MVPIICRAIPEGLEFCIEEFGIGIGGPVDKEVENLIIVLMKRSCDDVEALETRSVHLSYQRARDCPAASITVFLENFILNSCVSE